jgi:hypothetical protein
VSLSPGCHGEPVAVREIERGIVPGNANLVANGEFGALGLVHGQLPAGHRTELDGLPGLAAHPEPVAGPALGDLVEDPALEPDRPVVALGMDEVAGGVVLRERPFGLTLASSRGAWKPVLPEGDMGRLEGIFGSDRRRAALRSAIAAVEGGGGLDEALSVLAPLPVGLPVRREPDEAGIFDGLAGVFEALARDVRE